MRPATRRAPGQPIRNASGGAFVPPLVIAVGVVAWSLFRWSTGIVLEDALITYRFAENLALGNGFAFNPGERVLGTTTPLFTVLLALLGLVFGPDRIPVASVVVSILAAAGCAAFLYATLRAWSLGERAATLAALAFVLHPDVLWSTAGGMETALVLFFMAASLWALSVGRGALAAACAGLLVLTRPDGLIWALAILGALAYEKKRAALRDVAIFAAVILPWIVFATLYFGSPVPQSLVAKSVTAGAGNPLVLLKPSTVRDAWTAFADWMPFPPDGGFSPFEFALGFVLVALGARSLLSRSPRPAMVVLISFPALFAVAYYLGRAPHGFPWYGLPVTWACLALAAIGAADVLETRPWQHGDRLAQRAVRAACAAGAAILVLGWVYEVRRTYVYEREFQANELATRKAIGTWLDRTAPKDATVAMEAIGYQGVYAKRRIIDLAGLITPRVTALRRTSRSNAEVFGRVLEEFAPDYLVLRSFEVDRNHHRDGGPLFASAGAESAFHAAYGERLRVTAPFEERWGNASQLTVYGRQSRTE